MRPTPGMHRGLTTLLIMAIIGALLVAVRSVTALHSMRDHPDFAAAATAPGANILTRDAHGRDRVNIVRMAALPLLRFAAPRLYPSIDGTATP